MSKSNGGDRSSANFWAARGGHMTGYGLHHFPVAGPSQDRRRSSEGHLETADPKRSRVGLLHGPIGTEPIINYTYK